MMLKPGNQPCGVVRKGARSGAGIMAQREAHLRSVISDQQKLLDAKDRQIRALQMALKRSFHPEPAE